jgi:hypothetical protein
MAKIAGGEMLVRALEQEGAREIFTSMAAISRRFMQPAAYAFRVIDTRHERPRPTWQTDGRVRPSVKASRS